MQTCAAGTKVAVRPEYWFTLGKRVEVIGNGRRLTQTLLVPNDSFVAVVAIRLLRILRVK